ncbi:MAG: hypothetical protein GDA36_02655 [Rhodobacteraceae bacterium]|nr:hypothetical protein [Paracoccaceae bacterium]
MPNLTAGMMTAFSIRVVINPGDVFFDDDDTLGAGVNGALPLERLA